MADEAFERKSGICERIINMKIGAQLYTVRDFTQTTDDLAETLKRVSLMGYKYVHCSKLGPIPPETIRQLLDENGLVCAVTHVDPDLLLEDITGVIGNHKILGCTEIGMSIMPERYRGSYEGLLAMIKDYTPVIRKIKDAGMNFHYHNHDVEFIREGEQTLLDILMDEMPEIDLLFCSFWAQVAGADPIEYLNKYSDRIRIVHLKDMAVSIGATEVGNNRIYTPVLDGNMNYRKILQTCNDNPHIQFAMVEQDQCYGDPFACLERSHKNISSLGYKFA